MAVSIFGRSYRCMQAPLAAKFRPSGSERLFQLQSAPNWNGQLHSALTEIVAVEIYLDNWRL